MSYDLYIYIKSEIPRYDGDPYVRIDEPEYANPTYNLGVMFRKCMDWNFTQSEYYPVAFARERALHGLHELTTNRSEYLQYNPSNGWGDIDGAVEVLKSLVECIDRVMSDWPAEALWMSW